MKDYEVQVTTGEVLNVSAFQSSACLCAPGDLHESTPDILPNMCL